MADVTFSRTRQRLGAFGREIEASDFVRTNKDGSITRTSRGIACKPVPFPAGNWRIYDPRPRDRATQPHLAPYFIPTDATSLVPEWLLDAAGRYDKPSGRMVLADAYGIHYSTLDFTWGCIRIVHEDDLLWLVERIQRELQEIRNIDPRQAWVSLEVA
jgi:hypothetical protein